MMKQMLIKGLETIGANPPGSLPAPAKDEAILIEDLSDEELTHWFQAHELQKEISERAQKLYLLMSKADALREMFWTSVKLEHESIYEADQKDKCIGLRKWDKGVRSGRYAIVAMEKDENDSGPGSPQLFGPFLGLPG